ncbi:unnamed protein product [Boreogadus saida]
MSDKGFEYIPCQPQPHRHNSWSQLKETEWDRLGHTALQGAGEAGVAGRAPGGGLPGSQAEAIAHPKQRFLTLTKTQKEAGSGMGLTAK